MTTDWPLPTFRVFVCLALPYFEMRGKSCVVGHIEVTAVADAAATQAFVEGNAIKNAY